MATVGSQNVHSEMRDSKHLFSSRLLPSNAIYVCGTKCGRIFVYTGCFTRKGDSIHLTSLT